MRIRSLFMALPAVALGLACSTMGSGDRSARAGQDERGTATAGTTRQPEVGSAGTGMTGDLKGHASDQIITGRIADASEGSLVIESETGERQTVSVVDQTVVTIDGSDSSAASLTPGQDVRVSFNEQDGRHVAVKVEAMGMTGTDVRPEVPPGHPHHGSGTGGAGGTPPTDAPSSSGSSGSRQ